MTIYQLSGLACVLFLGFLVALFWPDSVRWPVGPKRGLAVLGLAVGVGVAGLLLLVMVIWGGCAKSGPIYENPGKIMQGACLGGTIDSVGACHYYEFPRADSAKS